MRAGLLLLAGLSVASAGTQLNRRRIRSETSALKSRQTSSYPVYTIDQPIDHFPNDARYAPHTNATFKQRYVYDSRYYKAGGPVYLYISGETSIESRLSNLETGIIQILMEATNGLGVIVENRYYGDSYPYTNLTTDNLVYLTNEQTIADFARFAQHATYPGLNATLTAPSTPYILYGGSLAGAQTAMAVTAYGDVVYGGIAASGVITVAVEYPQWYAPVLKFGPADCVASVADIVAKFDALVAANNTAAVAMLKAVFGLEALADDRDFAKTIAYPIGGPFEYPTATWQELIWTHSDAQFWQFCGNVTDLDAPEEVRAVDAQMAKHTGGEAWTNLGNYANYVKKVILPTCSTGYYAGGECFGQGNATWWTELADRETIAYLYSTCTELGMYQAAPATGPSLLSRVMNAAYTQEMCARAFPPGVHNALPAAPAVGAWAAATRATAPRLAFVDGAHDVWLDGCYHGTGGGGGALQQPPRDADLHPAHLVVSGGHHWDSTGRTLAGVPAEPPFIRETHRWEIRTVRRWLAAFVDWTPGRRGAGKR